MSEVKVYTLYAGGIEMEVTNFGGRVMKLLVEDRYGEIDDVVMGYNTIEEYLDNKGERYFGAVCGRFANRIAKGEFTLDGRDYRLATNNNGQALHGGIKGFDSVAWDVIKFDEKSIHFRYISPDGEEGYPGELTVDMLYELTREGEFVIEYEARTTRPTPINLTHHSYFNLAGEDKGDILDHTIRINADRFIPIDEVSIPTGEIASVEGTPFDFREAKCIGEDIDADNHQIKMGAGYDHCFVINGREGAMKLAAEVIEPISGRRMEVYTDQPGMQFYSGNFLDGSITSKSTLAKYPRRGSFALETQLFPDSPNQPQFPSSILEPGYVYSHRCIYKFDCID